MEGLIVLGAIIVIIVAACAASEFKKIAEAKVRNSFMSTEKTLGIEDGKAYFNGSYHKKL